jgi:RNA polymerase sigma-54 factor
MRIETGQHQKLEQRLKLAPRMIQSMEILQLPAVALTERIEQELASNPTLEADTHEETRESETAEPASENEGERELVVSDGDEKAKKQEDFERLTSFSEDHGAEAAEAGFAGMGGGRRASGPQDEEGDPKMEAMANTAARPLCLPDQLAAQWDLVEAPPQVHEAGRYLTGLVDEDGYIRGDWQEILDAAPKDVDAGVLTQALDMLQRNLDPPGLAARDLRQCLLLQIDAEAGHQPDPAPHLQRRLVDEHLDDVEANRLPRIAERLSVSLEEVKVALHALRRFHPHPGRLLVPEAPQTITPDARVRYDAERDRFFAELTDQRIPPLAINDDYRKLASDRAVDRDTRRFVRENLHAARWLIDAIQQRQTTLLRVIQAVLDEQRPFFESGSRADLKPLPMTAVADRLGVHVATVSRAVSEKHLQTPHGIHPLRMFFSGGTETASGEELSWTAIQARLRELLENEDKSAPLNDDQLAEKLKAEGIDVARRTVAKYRKELKYPSARQRKQH